MGNKWGPHDVTNGTTRLAELVRARGLTRPQIMAATGISDKTLQRYLTQNGYKMNLSYRVKLARLLEVHPNEL